METMEENKQFDSTALAGLYDTLTISASADPAKAGGEDNYVVTVTGYTS